MNNTALIIIFLVLYLAFILSLRILVIALYKRKYGVKTVSEVVDLMKGKVRPHSDYPTIRNRNYDYHNYFPVIEFQDGKKTIKKELNLSYNNHYIGEQIPIIYIKFGNRYSISFDNKKIMIKIPLIITVISAYLLFIILVLNWYKIVF